MLQDLASPIYATIEPRLMNSSHLQPSQSDKTTENDTIFYIIYYLRKDYLSKKEHLFKKLSVVQ